MAIDGGFALCLKCALPCFGPVVQLVRMPPCHGGGRGFESRRDRKEAEVAHLVEHDLAKVGVASSSLVFRSKSPSSSAGRATDL